MTKTSVHIKPCDIAASETHNSRKKELGYVRKDLSSLNESFSYIGHNLQTELAMIKRDVKQKTGRKLQKNAIPIKEGVVVISEETTMDDMKKFCEECQRQLGIIPLQIHIHRDEGHSSGPETGDWKPNLHAHVVWRMYGEDGRNIRLSKEDCAAMQTIAAQSLGMDRGVSSERKHLNSIQFKVAQEEKRLATVRKEASEALEVLSNIENLREEQERLSESLELARMVNGCTDIPEPTPNASNEEWKQYYSNFDVPRPLDPITRTWLIELSKNRDNSVSGKVYRDSRDRDPLEFDATTRMYRHVQYGIATKLQIAMLCCAPLRAILRELARNLWSLIKNPSQITEVYRGISR